LGKTTSVKMKSPWISPSFDGAFLPLDKNITKIWFQFVFLYWNPTKK